MITDYKTIAKLLGIKIQHTTQSQDGEYWQVKTPVSVVTPSPFSNETEPVYRFTNEKELEGFVWGYSLALCLMLKEIHRPRKDPKDSTV